MLGKFGSLTGVTTRKYPVHLQKLHGLLEQDLAKGYDVVLHTGQLPGATQVQLEMISLNIAGNTIADGERSGPIIAGAPLAYQSTLPLHSCAKRIREQGIPAKVSYHAGVYLCNAVMFMSQHWFAQRGLDARVAFVHLPLTSSQAQEKRANHTRIDSVLPDSPSLPIESMATAIHTVIQSSDESVRV
jgi:pyroglutamyl-peptidase